MWSGLLFERPQRAVCHNQLPLINQISQAFDAQAPLVATNRRQLIVNCQPGSLHFCPVQNEVSQVPALGPAVPAGHRSMRVAVEPLAAPLHLPLLVVPQLTAGLWRPPQAFTGAAPANSLFPGAPILSTANPCTWPSMPTPPLDPCPGPSCSSASSSRPGGQTCH